ncbi:major facilitator superfamily domain-containing protein [Chytridium lagenaria]|nr:major facilitator superfamily domain-containing protein [Chytridium lagenaria]
MGIKELIFKHYGDSTYHRTEKQIEKEQWLIPNVLSFNRWILFPAALIIQLCCGSLYAWSGFNSPIETALYGPNGLVDRGMASILLGPWLERNGPFRGALLGASLFYFGNLLTALGVHFRQISIICEYRIPPSTVSLPTPLSFSQLILIDVSKDIGYGLFSGAGLGVAYIAPVSPLQKWFPEIRGLAAGIAVCGFGGGSIIAPYTQKALIGADFAKLGEPGKNLGVPLTFVILGSFYFMLMALSAFVLRMPPPGYCVNGITIDTVKGAENADTAAVTRSNGTINSDVKKTFSETTSVSTLHRDKISDFATIDIHESKAKSVFAMTLWESLTSIEYGLMYFMFFGSQVTGLLIISKIQQITVTQLGRSTDEAALINSLLGGSNLLGRLILPFASDLFHSRKSLFVLSAFTQTVLLGLLPTIIHSQSYGAFLFAVNVIAFFYGGGFGIIPAFLADQFGSKNVGATHGVILTAWAIAGVCGGLTFTAVYNSELAKVYDAATKKYNSPDAKLNVYTLNFRWILAFVLVGFIMAILVPSHIRDRKLPRVEGEMMRVRIFGRMVRVVKGKGVVVVSQAVEDEEWHRYLESLSNE